MKYRERENELRADEVAVGRQLVRATLHSQAVGIDFHVARAPREEG